MIIFCGCDHPNREDFAKVDSHKPPVIYEDAAIVKKKI